MSEVTRWWAGDRPTGVRLTDRTVGDTHTGRRGRGRRRGVAALIVVVALVAPAGCGARLTGDERAAGVAAESAARGGHGMRTAASSSASSGGPERVGGATTAGSGVAGGSGGGGGTSGTASPGAPGLGGRDPGGDGGAGPGSGGAGADAGAGSAADDDCVALPVDEVGVTDTEIVLGNVSMISGPIPGAGQTGVDGTRAYLDYVNSQGGVCGRTLRLLTGDDRTDAGQNRAEHVRLSSEVLGFVGGATIVDAGVAAALEGTNIPAAQLSVDDRALRSTNIFSPSPLDPTGTTAGSESIWRFFASHYGLQRVAIITLAISSARARAETYVNDIEAAGLDVVGFHEVALTETNYVSLAQQLENEGAEGFISLIEPTGMARLASALRQVGYQPKVPFYGAQAYGGPFLELAGEAAEGAVLGLAVSMFEDAPTNPAVAAFNEWFARTAPGRSPDFFAQLGWASADMMVQALRAAGGAPTRDAVLAWLRNLTSFDAHGFIAPCNPAGKVTSSQFLVVTVEGGQWRRVYPATGFGDGS